MTVKKEILNCYAASHLVCFTASLGDSLQIWLEQEQEQVNDLLAKHGAILFRNFSITSDTEFQTVSQFLIPKLFDYSNGTTRKECVLDKVYTSAAYPANLKLGQHSQIAPAKRVA